MKFSPFMQRYCDPVPLFLFAKITSCPWVLLELRLNSFLFYNFCFQVTALPITSTGPANKDGPAEAIPSTERKKARPAQTHPIPQPHSLGLGFSVSLFLSDLSPRPYLDLRGRRKDSSRRRPLRPVLRSQYSMADYKLLNLDDCKVDAEGLADDDEVDLDSIKEQLPGDDNEKLLDLNDYKVDAEGLPDDDEVDLDSIKEQLPRDDSVYLLARQADVSLCIINEYHLPLPQLDDGHDNGMTLSELDYMLWDDARFDEQLEDNSQDDFGLIHLFDENQQLLDLLCDDNHIPYYDVAVPIFEVYADGNSFLFPDADDSFFGIEPVELEIQVWVDRTMRYSRRGCRLIQQAGQMINKAKSSGFHVIPDSELEDMISLRDRIWTYAVWLCDYHSECEAYLLEVVDVRRPVRHPLMVRTEMLDELISCLIRQSSELMNQIRIEEKHKLQYPIWQQQCVEFMHHLLHPEEDAMDAGQLVAVDAGNAMDAGELEAVDAGDAMDAGQLVAVDAGNAMDAGELDAGDAMDAGQLVAVDAGDAMDAGELEAVDAGELEAAEW